MRAHSLIIIIYLPAPTCVTILQVMFLPIYNPVCGSIGVLIFQITSCAEEREGKKLLIEMIAFVI